VAIVVIAAIVVLIRRETDRLAARAEAAYPGPLSAAPPSARQAPASPRANAGSKVPRPGRERAGAPIPPHAGQQRATQSLLAGHGTTDH